MKKLSKHQWIAVAAGLAVVAFFLYGGIVMSLFIPSQPPVAMSSTDTAQVSAPGDTITVNYVGTFENGKVFDSSIDRGQPFTFVLGQGRVIPGWDKGLVGMKVGEKRHLIVPPADAYGPQGYGPIPPNSTLVFDVELLGIQKAE